LGDPKNPFATPVAAALMVGAWGYFLIQGVRDPLGGINSLWPLFGIANQMLAAIALCLGTTIILKMQLQPESKVQSPKSKVGRPVLALITLIPLVWLVAVTFTAGVQKIFHPDPRIGFLAQASELHQKVPMLEKNLGSALASADATAIAAAEPALHSNQMLEFNNRLDAAVAGTFLVLVTAIIFLSVREWILLLSRRKPAVLHETEPVWLPEYALKETGPNFRTAAGAAVIAFGFAKELSGESHFERAQQTCGGHCFVNAPTDAKCSVPSVLAELAKRRSAPLQKIYVAVTEERYNGVRRCC
jgi:carbon starvation protein